MGSKVITKIVRAEEGEPGDEATTARMDHTQELRDEKDELLRDCGLDYSTVRRKCSDDHINDIAGYARIAWRFVGPYLPRIDKNDIDKDIDIDGINQRDKRRKLLNLWVERNADAATYDVLITAMLRARKKDDATFVCRLLIAGQFIAIHILEGWLAEAYYQKGGRGRGRGRGRGY